MHPACEVCRGACCESLYVPIARDKATRDFYNTRGQVFTVLGQPHDIAEIDSQCRHLDICGRCVIHDSKPAACDAFEVGCKECRLAIKRRRSHQADDILRLIDHLPTNDPQK